MKKILLVVATSEEFKAVESFAKLSLVSEEIFKIYSCQFYDKEIDVIRSGIGKGAMCFALGYCFAKKKYDLVINTGVAGGLFKRIKPFSVVTADKTAFYDVDLTGIEDVPVGKLDDLPLYFMTDNKFLQEAKKLNVKQGTILSGDLFITKDNLPNDIDINFDHPIAIDMESAAVGEACYLAQTPYSILRTISDDTTASDNGDQYNDGLSESCATAIKTVFEILKEY